MGVAIASRGFSAAFTLAEQKPDEIGVEPSTVRFVWERRSPRVTIELELDGATVPVDAIEPPDGVVANVRGDHVRLDMRRWQDLMADLVGSMYLGPFRNAVNVGGSSAYYDLQIGEQFIAEWDISKTGSNRAQNRAALRLEQELAGIFGVSGLQINAAPGNATLQVIADGEPYQLQEQGAGLAQIIVVMAYVATRTPAWVFIDEPELNLHPSLQLDFLTTLAKYSKRGVAFATHSIGLARAIGQEVYSVRRQADGRREVRQLEGTRNLVEFLGELNFSGYQELSFTRVLLVEGSTEVPVVQRWLRLYGSDHEIVLLPLGGSSLINATSGAALAEIRRITVDVSVLLDSERDGPEAPLDVNRQAFVETCGELGFGVHVLERRAIENYLTDAAIKTVKGESYHALEPFQRLSAAARAWSKNENWRIAAEMTKADLDETDLGPFFDGIS